ncbi:MAG: RrF2 family transcriptional regulator [Christensenellales bacterium]|jgi:Rrf2 family protein
MRFSSKGRYAMASMISIAQTAGEGESVTVNSLAKRLEISKIYLEQIFSLLRKSGLVISIKGSQGGYQLARPAGEITAYDILSATETSLFDEPEFTVSKSAPDIESAMQSLVFRPPNNALTEMFSGVSLADLAKEADRNRQKDAYMYYL